MAQTTPEQSPSDSGPGMQPPPDPPPPATRGQTRQARTDSSGRPSATPPDAPEPPSDEQQLLLAARAGNREAMAELLTRYQDRLYRVCLNVVQNRDTATDLTQDTMVKVIAGLHQFNGTSRLSTWMTRIAVNVCLTHLRRQRLRRHASLDAPLPDQSGTAEHSDTGPTFSAQLRQDKEPESEQRIEESERLEQLRRGLAMLAPDQRVVLILRDMQELDYQQIGEILDVPQGTVKSRIFRARMALREKVETLEGGGEEQGSGEQDA